MDIVIEKTRERGIFRQCLPLTLLWLGCLVYLEVLLHIVVFEAFSLRFLYAVGFSLCAACLLGFVSGLMRGPGNRRVCTVIACVLCFFYASQLTYYFVFGSMYSLSMVSLGPQAVVTFWQPLISTIWEHIPVLLLCFAPVPAVCLLRKFRGRLFDGGSVLRRLPLIASAVLLHALLLLCLRAGGTGVSTAYAAYFGSDTSTIRSTANFGLLTTSRLELEHIFIPLQEDEPYYVLEPVPPAPSPTPTANVDGTGGETEEPEPEPEIEYGYNVLDIDFDALAASTDDERLKRLSQYCAQLTGTKKNEYTGMLSDYNLIVICGESFSTAVLDEELTPTLWRMAHEGFVFTNYFNSFPNLTSNGEYALCQGLLPDMGRHMAASSFYASRNSYLPMCLGNIFREQRGIDCFGYHGNVRGFYGRYLTHPNIGYQMKFAKDGLTFPPGWPSSDLEMVEQSIPDYLGQDQFHAYYMTYSGHYKYNLGNPMAAKNYDAVKDLPYTEQTKCYLACNLELEKAVAYLMEQLEEAGVADRTAIVLAGDHFPYGLTNEEYSDLIGHEADFFELYRDTLIFWVGGMDEPVTVDEYCCNVDILPTILNLWGFDFDSRLLAGTDVFSDGTHVAMLADKSFLTDAVWFNSETGETVWQAEENEFSQAYLDSMIAFVQNRFTSSSDILVSAYYNFVFGKDPVTVDINPWKPLEDENGAPNDAELPPEQDAGDGQDVGDGQDTGNEQAPGDGQQAQEPAPPAEDQPQTAPAPADQAPAAAGEGE